MFVQSHIQRNRHHNHNNLHHHNQHHPSLSSTSSTSSQNQNQNHHHHQQQQQQQNSLTLDKNLTKKVFSNSSQNLIHSLNLQINNNDNDIRIKEKKSEKTNRLNEIEDEINNRDYDKSSPNKFNKTNSYLNNLGNHNKRKSLERIGKNKKEFYKKEFSFDEGDSIELELNQETNSIKSRKRSYSYNDEKYQFNSSLNTDDNIALDNYNDSIFDLLIDEGENYMIDDLKLDSHLSGEKLNFNSKILASKTFNCNQNVNKLIRNQSTSSNDKSSIELKALQLDSNSNFKIEDNNFKQQQKGSQTSSSLLNIDNSYIDSKTKKEFSIYNCPIGFYSSIENENFQDRKNQQEIIGKKLNNDDKLNYCDNNNSNNNNNNIDKTVKTNSTVNASTATSIISRSISSSRGGSKLELFIIKKKSFLSKFSLNKIYLLFLFKKRNLIFLQSFLKNFLSYQLETFHNLLNDSSYIPTNNNNNNVVNNSSDNNLKYKSTNNNTPTTFLKGFSEKNNDLNNKESKLFNPLSSQVKKEIIIKNKLNSLNEINMYTTFDYQTKHHNNKHNEDIINSNQIKLADSSQINHELLINNNNNNNNNYTIENNNNINRSPILISNKAKSIPQVAFKPISGGDGFVHETIPSITTSSPIDGMGSISFNNSPYDVYNNHRMNNNYNSLLSERKLLSSENFQFNRNSYNYNQTNNNKPYQLISQRSLYDDSSAANDSLNEDLINHFITNISNCSPTSLVTGKGYQNYNTINNDLIESQKIMSKMRNRQYFMDQNGQILSKQMSETMNDQNVWLENCFNQNQNQDQNFNEKQNFQSFTNNYEQLCKKDNSRSLQQQQSKNSLINTSFGLNENEQQLSIDNNDYNKSRHHHHHNHHNRRHQLLNKKYSNSLDNSKIENNDQLSYQLNSSPSNSIKNNYYYFKNGATSLQHRRIMGENIKFKTIRENNNNNINYSFDSNGNTLNYYLESNNNNNYNNNHVTVRNPPIEATKVNFNANNNHLEFNALDARLMLLTSNGKFDTLNVNDKCKRIAVNSDSELYSIKDFNKDYERHLKNKNHLINNNNNNSSKNATSLSVSGKRNYVSVDHLTSIKSITNGNNINDELKEENNNNNFNLSKRFLSSSATNEIKSFTNYQDKFRPNSINGSINNNTTTNNTNSNRKIAFSPGKLSLAGAKKRFGFKQKAGSGLNSLSVQRSEEIVPYEAAKYLVRELTFNSFSDSGNESGSVASVDPNCCFVEGLGVGQIASRQALVSPYLGDIQLTLSDRRGMLEVEVVRARQLQIKPAAKMLPSPYVKIYLMKNKKCIAKCKTNTAIRTLNPLYQQQFIFREDYNDCILQIIVWGDYGKKDRKSLMGIVQIHLNDLDISNLVIGWYRLFNAPSMASSISSSKALRHSILVSSKEATLPITKTTKFI